MKNLSVALNKTWFHLILLAVAVFIAYSKIFNGGFAPWDDADYVTGNKDIAAITGDNIAAWFSKFYVGTYEPLTMLSYAIDHLTGGQQPQVYHLTNLLLHIANCMVLYFLLNRIQPNKITGLFAALLFALNPIQTEAVSWIAERKTLLCALFSLLALLQYVGYVAKPAPKKYWLVLLFAVLALLSKAAAVSLPLAMLAVDVWLQRDLRRSKPWIEKLPLLALSVITGIIAIRAEEAGGFIGMHGQAGWSDTIVFAAYAYVQYIVHFFVPVHLSVVYPYPREAGLVQYLYLFAAAGILIIAVIAWRKKWRVLLGGIIFYTVNIALVLQFVQFGEVLMADRYLYIACIGLLFPAVHYFVLRAQRAYRGIPALAAGCGITAVFLAATFLRNEIWLSDLNFFNAILNAFPDSAVAQYSVGGLYLRTGDYHTAERYINSAVIAEPGNYKAWYNKGVLYLRERNPQVSLEAFNRCLALKEYTRAYFSRALLYEGTGQPALALPDIEKVLAVEPQNARAYYIKADCLEQQNKLTDALDNYNKAIASQDDDPLFFIRRGLIYAKMNQPATALRDLNTAVSMNPDDGEALYFRGVVKYRNGGNGCDDLRNALSHGYRQAQDMLAQACGH